MEMEMEMVMVVAMEMAIVMVMVMAIATCMEITSYLIQHLLAVAILLTWSSWQKRFDEVWQAIELPNLTDPSANTAAMEQQDGDGNGDGDGDGDGDRDGDGNDTL